MIQEVFKKRAWLRVQVLKETCSRGWEGIFEGVPTNLYKNHGERVATR